MVHARWTEAGPGGGEWEVDSRQPVLGAYSAGTEVEAPEELA